MLEEIKKDDELGRIPVVVLTTSAADEDILRSYQLHANAYVTKPVDFERFIAVIRQIDEFFVGPSYRSLGIGSRLLAAAEATFLVRGCTNVALQIGRDNQEARAFYRRHGYGDRAGFDIVDKDLP